MGCNSLLKQHVPADGEYVGAHPPVTLDSLYRTRDPNIVEDSERRSVGQIVMLFL